MSEYIRNASLNESFILEDVVGKNLIFNIVSETLTDIREIMQEIRNMFPKILLREDIEYLKYQQDKIYDSINDLKKTVIDTLSLKYIRKCKQRKIQESLISDLEE